MADLNHIFEESGLEGIIPYAFGLRGKGYDFLRNKLLSGTPFWAVLCNASNVPFFFTDEDKVYFSIYTSEELTSQKCDELAMNNLYCTPSYVEIGARAPEMMKRYRDLGINYLFVNDSVWVAISDLAPAATYDGMLTPQTPLRNAALNAALYTTIQYVAAEISCDALLAYFWDIFLKSHVIVPVFPNEDLLPSQALTPENTTPHLLETEDGKRYLAAFTDPEFLAIYAEENGFEQRDYTAVFTPTYADLREYLDVNPDVSGFIINNGRGDFLVDDEIVKEFELIALNENAKGGNN